MLILSGVMIPAQLFGFEHHKSFFNLFIRLVTLFGEHTFLNSGPWILNKHSGNFLDYETLLRLQGYLVL